MDTRVLRAAFPAARLLVIVALVIGGLAGWLGFLNADGSDAVGRAVAGWYLLLAIALPATLALYVWALQQTTLPTAMRQTGAGIAPLLVAAVAGSLIGSAGFWLIATMITGSIGGEDLNAVRNAIIAEIPLINVLLVVGLTCIAAVLLSLWASGSARQSS